MATLIGCVGRTATRTRGRRDVRPGEYTEAELELVVAADDYKRRHGRPEPDWSDLLLMLEGLGYRDLVEVA